MNLAAAANGDEAERILPDQLLVSTPYVPAVLAKLQGAKFNINVDAARDIDESVALGLTRIHFKGPYDGTFAELEHGRVLNVGAVLDQLRLEFREENAGWCPSMGKNRALSDNIIGGGSMIYKGVDDPTTIPPETLSAVRNRNIEWPQNQPDGRRIRVGMVDTRVLRAGPLAGVLDEDSDFLDENEEAIRAGHATFVAGLIHSVAPGVQIKVRGVLDNNGVSDSWEAAQAIVELGNKVDILNLSFGCITGDGQAPLALSTAIDLIDAKTVIVAAAGNFDRKGPLIADIDNEKNVEVRKCASFPAALDNVIAVGSAQDGEITDYSPHGPWVDVYADGGTDESRVQSTFLQTEPYGGYAAWKGTSFAAALVTGAIAAEMNPEETSAHRAWMAVKERFKVENLQVPPPPTISSRVIQPRQWF